MILFVAGNAALYCHCEKRSDAAIHKMSKIDCFAALAMTKILHL
jgi:hypothetical protein